MKLCINCKHYNYTGLMHECLRNFYLEVIGVNLVTGSSIYKETEILDCEIERAKTTAAYCGVEGVFFE